jgi:GTP-binding protein
LIEGYLKQSPQLRGIVLLLDARREPSDDDRAMLDFLAEAEIPTLVAITKIDKFGPRAGEVRTAAIVEALSLEPGQVIPVSARTGSGRDALAAALMERIDAGTAAP